MSVNATFSFYEHPKQFSSLQPNLAERKAAYDAMLAVFQDVDRLPNYLKGGLTDWVLMGIKHVNHSKHRLGQDGSPEAEHWTVRVFSGNHAIATLHVYDEDIGDEPVIYGNGGPYGKGGIPKTRIENYLRKWGRNIQF